MIAQYDRICFMKKSKINFIESIEDSKVYFPAPVTSKSLIPNWYKEMKNFVPMQDRRSMETIKACIPFLDAISIGYSVRVPCDILFTVSNDENYPEIKVETRQDFLVTVGDHDPKQIHGFPISKDIVSIPLKWMLPWGIETPKGYSTFFFHPNNKFDLPFQTMSGVVDTDKYNMPVNFPFFLKRSYLKNNEIFIEEGTEICQFIPFKRDSWGSKITEYNYKDQNIRTWGLTKKMFNSYKKNFWTRKDFS